MPRMKIVAFLSLRCPTCGYSQRYDGKSPATECPDCKKREDELEGISSIGESLARKDRAG